MYKTQNENQLVSIILSYNKTKSWEKDFIYYNYNHILKYFNTIKVNLKVENTMVTKIVKRYSSSNISRNIKNMKQITNKKTLKDIEENYFDLKKYI